MCFSAKPIEAINYKKDHKGKTIKAWKAVRLNRHSHIHNRKDIVYKKGSIVKAKGKGIWEISKQEHDRKWDGSTLPPKWEYEWNSANAGIYVYLTKRRGIVMSGKGKSVLWIQVECKVSDLRCINKEREVATFREVKVLT